jgi:uncharacterized protein (TIGR00730 family)
MSKRIGIFLSSHESLPASFGEAAESVGRWMGRNGHTLVYGGSSKGLMETLAQSTRQNGGRVIGVVPQILTEQGDVSDALNVTFHCADLNDRKAIMMRESDLFIALPGGIGTLDEIFTVLAADTIGLCNKHIILYNTDGCWTPALALLDHLRQQGLVSSAALAYLHTATTTEELDALCSRL